MLLVQAKILLHPEDRLLQSRIARRSHHAPLNGRGPLVVTQLGERHGHRLAEIGALLVFQKILNDRHGAAAIAHAIVRSGGQQTRKRVRKVGLVRMVLDRVGQPRASVLITAQVDEAPSA
jgi:hypothetical protein